MHFPTRIGDLKPTLKPHTLVPILFQIKKFEQLDPYK